MHKHNASFNPAFFEKKTGNAGKEEDFWVSAAQFIISDRVNPCDLNTKAIHNAPRQLHNILVGWLTNSHEKNALARRKLRCFCTTNHTTGTWWE